MVGRVPRGVVVGTGYMGTGDTGYWVLGPCMALYGPVWHCMARYGPLWQCMARYGTAWPSIDPLLHCMAQY